MHSIYNSIKKVSINNIHVYKVIIIYHSVKQLVILKIIKKKLSYNFNCQDQKLFLFTTILWYFLKYKLK